MTKEEINNLQHLFKNSDDFENIRLGLSIIQTEKFYFSQINGFANRLIDNWDEWTQGKMFRELGTFPFITYVNAIYNALDYEQNRIR